MLSNLWFYSCWGLGKKSIVIIHYSRYLNVVGSDLFPWQLFSVLVFFWFLGWTTIGLEQ